MNETFKKGMIIYYAPFSTKDYEFIYDIKRGRLSTMNDQWDDYEELPDRFQVITNIFVLADLE